MPADPGSATPPYANGKAARLDVARTRGAEPLPPLYRDSLFWLTLALTLFAVAPFLQPGYFWGANDARHQVYFLFEFDRVLQDGVWWPRWSPDFAFGYGYPFFNIYAPFSHFVAAILHRVGGLSLPAAIEGTFVISIVASAGAMYACTRDWLGRAHGRQAALVSGLVYTYAPYHLLNLYVRATLAESMVLLWLPLCLWTFRRLVQGQWGWRPAWGWAAAAATCYGGMMLTSNLVIVLFTPLLALYVWTLMAGRVWAGRPPGLAVGLGRFVRLGLSPALGIGGGLGLSAIFWLPMLLEYRYVRVDQWFSGRYDFRDNFLYFFQLFSPRWGFGVSQAGPDDPIGFQIGAAAFILATIGALLAWQSRPKLRCEILLFSLAAVLTAAVTLQPLAPIWEWPLIGAILRSAQFPWRWLAITLLCVSLLAGLVMVPQSPENSRPSRRTSRTLSLPLLLVAATVLLSSYPLLQVQVIPPAEGPVGLAALMRFQRDADEMTGSTAWVKEIPTWSPMAEYYVNQERAGGPVEPVSSKLDYANVDYSSLTLSSVAHNTVMEEVYFCTAYAAENGRCSAVADQQIVFNHFYYPGWRAYLLEEQHGRRLQELPVIPESTGTLGRMTVPIPAVGEGYILLRYEDTLPRTLGKILSGLTLALMASLGFWRWLSRRLGAGSLPRSSVMA